MSDALPDYEPDEREHTSRTIQRLTPRESDVPRVIAQIRADRIADRRELRRWGSALIASVLAGAITIAVAAGRYQERVDGVARSVERIENLMIRGGER